MFRCLGSGVRSPVSQEAGLPLFAAKLQILIPRPRSPLIPFLRRRLIVSKCTVFEVDNAETVNCIIGAFRRASQPSCASSAAAASSAGLEIPRHSASN